MARLIMWNLVSLDGYFEGATSGDLAFHQYAWGPELEAFIHEQSKTVGTLLFGRVTYQGMASYWSTQTGAIADFMNGIPKVVFSRTLDSAKWSNSRLVKSKIKEEVLRLKKESGKDLFLFGSANLGARLSAQGLIDEYRLGVVPVVLGQGRPLFEATVEPMNLKFLEARPLGPKCLLLRLEPERAPH
ncbi:MAG: dihydrofolate reductase family protein [Thermoplasmata archaeon]